MLRRRNGSSVDARLNAAFSFENASKEPNDGHAYERPLPHPPRRAGRRGSQAAKGAGDEAALVQAGESSGEPSLVLVHCIDHKY
jgi:hypothetical protein